MNDYYVRSYSITGNGHRSRSVGEEATTNGQQPFPLVRRRVDLIPAEFDRATIPNYFTFTEKAYLYPLKFDSICSV
jgi:hypothetical protein